MKGIIIFASRSGNTNKIASKLHELIENHEFERHNIIENKNPDIESKDIIVLGSYMRRQLADPDIIEFTQKNKDILLKKKVYIFVLASEEGETYQREIRNSFPQKLLDKVEVVNIGAILNLDQVGFVDKVMLQEMAKRQGKQLEELENYSEEKLKQFAKTISEYVPSEDDEEE